VRNGTLIVTDVGIDVERPFLAERTPPHRLSLPESKARPCDSLVPVCLLG